MERWYQAWRNTWNGLARAARTEQAVREELAALALALPVALLIGLTWERRLQLIAVVMLVLIVELLNTAIEKLADRVTTERDPLIGYVKDMGSAAVAVAIIIAGLTWLFAAAERLLAL